MTREEAKDILEEVKQFDDSIYQYNIKYLEALDMAIKALEQEPIIDKIKAEIEQVAFKDVNGSKYIFVNRVNQIIDIYKAESEKE